MRHLLESTLAVPVDESLRDMILGDKMKAKGVVGIGHSDVPNKPLEETDNPAEGEAAPAPDPDRVDAGKPGAYDKVIYKVPFGVSDIADVYVGKPGTCMCGCSGTYYYRKATQEHGSKNRGYAVGDEEVNDAKVERVFKKMKKNALLGIEVIDDYIYTVVVGNTQYTIYLLKQ